MVQPLHKQLQQTVARVSSSRVRPLQHFLMLRQQQLSDFMPKSAVYPSKRTSEDGENQFQRG